MLNIVLIATILVLIIDLSGFTDSWKSGLKKMLTGGKMSGYEYSLKPFDCSLCMTFWFGIGYLLITHTFTLPMLTWVLFVAFLTPVIKDMLILIRESMIHLIAKIYEEVYRG